MVIHTCKVCGNTNNNQLHDIKEMQLGLREMFTYLECANCGCMQLQNIPANLGKYYPNEGYYSFNLGLDVRQKADTLRKIKASYLIYGKKKLAGEIVLMMMMSLVVDVLVNVVESYVRRPSSILKLFYLEYSYGYS